ncbi:MAG: tyrosine-type recombinase/integrase [Proteobacteria bacterium]|nr:tyrosine-type recombinase/integrase [Pseudomonadota bacterium]
MLKAHVNEFIDYCKVVGFSPRSRGSLAITLREFVAFVGGQPIEAPGEVSYGLLSSFVADYLEPSVHKKKARVWCLHQFFHFLTVTGVVRENPATGLPYPKIEKTVPFFLTAVEYNRVIEYFSDGADSPVGFRNLVMVLVLGLLGVRTSTLIALNIEDIDTEAGLALVWEKGDRRRHMVLPELLTEVLGVYLERLDADSGPLFPSKRSKRISQRTMQVIFQAAASDLGLGRPLHARLFRHTAATLLNQAAGTTVTQAVLGHERRANTLRYTHLNPDKYGCYMQRHPYMRRAEA